MRYFAYDEDGSEKPVILPEEEIVATYSPYLKKSMEAHGELNNYSDSLCVGEWVIDNWAWEVDKHGHAICNQ
jgi:hypothetical protein